MLPQTKTWAGGGLLMGAELLQQGSAFSSQKTRTLVENAAGPQQTCRTLAIQ